MAGTNRYEQPAESNFINTYAPINFPAMAGGLAEKQRAYELTAAKKGQFTDFLEDFKVGPGKDERDYQEKMAGLDQELADLNESTPDIGSLEHRTKLNKIIFFIIYTSKKRKQ